jgi:hypothetical protein
MNHVLIVFHAVQLQERLITELSLGDVAGGQLFLGRGSRDCDGCYQLLLRLQQGSVRGDEEDVC